MNKLFTKIVGTCLGLAMAVGTGVAVGVGASKETVPVHAAATDGTEQVLFNSSNSYSASTSYTTKGAIKFKNSASNSYSDPTRIYANNTFTIEIADSSLATSINGIVITANSSSYATVANNATWAVTDGSGSISHSVSSSVVTGTTSGTVKSVTITPTAQTRWNSVTVYYAGASTTEATGMTINPSSAEVYAGETVTFTPTLTGGSGSYEKTISWASSNTSVVASPANSEDGAAVTVTTLVAGSTTITGTVVSPGSASGSISITVKAPKTLDSISVATAPSKTIYSEGEKFDPTGLVINRHYTDETSDTYTYANHTSDFSFTPSTSTDLTTSDTSVTITYGGKSTTQAITVNEVTKYELITDASDLVAGCDYLIGNAAQTYFMSTTQNSNNRGRHTLVGSVSNNKVGYEDGMEVVTLGGSSGAWTLYANNSETAGYLYLPSNNNYLRTQSSSFSWDISFSNGTPSISATVTNTRYIKHNSNSSIFSCYQNGQEDVSLWKEVSTAQSISISENSVSGFKGDTDTSLSITAVNFTPTNIEVSYSTAGVATVTKGTIDDGIIPLNVAFNTAGTTTASITVKGGTQDYSVDLAISVSAKPASMTIVHGDIVAGHLEIQTGLYKQVSFSGLDTDGQPYAITASDVTGSVESGSSYVSLSGTRINTTTAGTAVVRYTLKALTSVYAEVTVDVVDDYKTSVNAITFNSGLTATQGESVNTSEVFASKIANTHFGSTTTIEDGELLFSYINDRSEAVTISMFAYDFSGTTVDSTHKLQTVYVFVSFDSSYAGTSFSITVEQANDPLTAITLTNSEIADDEVDLARGSSLQLTWALTPTNPTDGRELQFSVDDNDEGVKVSVSDAGLISVAADSGLGAATILVEAVHNISIKTYLYVNVTLESMKYQVNEAETWTVASSIAVGDRIVISGAHNSVNYELTGVSSNIGQVASFEDDPAGTFTLTVGAGNTANSYTFSSGTNYLAYTSTATSGSNNLYTITNPSTTDQLNQVSWTVSISNGSATITNVYNTNRKILLNYNNGSPRFCAYTSNASSTMHLPSIYKLTGGLSTKDVDVTLFNAIHNNFGEEKTYEWDEVCASFKSANWTSAGSAVTSISGFANYKLNRAVANANGNEIEQFLAKYDVVIAKFGTTYDFLGRFTTGGINASQRIVNPMSNIFNNSSTTAIIVVISLVSITAIGGYFFLANKRKEQ